MASRTFPGTATGYVLLGEAVPGSGYSAIFRTAGEPGGNMASLDAGDGGLYVGGGGINKVFGQALGTPSLKFEDIHRETLASARLGKPVRTRFDADDPVIFVSVRLANAAAPTIAFPAETAWIEIFAPGIAPHGEPTNTALLYVVPPDGRTSTGHYTSDAEFLAAVERTAYNAVAVLADYNSVQVAAHAGLGLEPIPVLRTCLMSGMSFKPEKLPQSDVARAIFDGFTAALVAAGAGSGITLVEFESGSDEFAAIG